MFQTLKSAFKNKEIRNKILITIALLFVFRLGSWIPVPGIIVPDRGAGGGLAVGNILFELLSAIGGQALANGALLAIGIAPYINASIITQLLTVAIPKLEQWSKQGDDGRKKIERVTRVLTLILAIVQAIGIAVSWYPNSLRPIFGGQDNLWLVATIVAAIMVAGAMFTMWLGERITELGIGNGMSLLIFIGIVASAGLALYANIWHGMIQGDQETRMQSAWILAMFLGFVVLIFFFIVFIEGAERRIPVVYAKQVKGNKVYGGQSTHIPIKVNANGVLPIIFATALITFPQILMQLIGANAGPETIRVRFLGWWVRWVSPQTRQGSVIYFILMGLLILAFSYFYAQIQFKPDEVARNLQQYGGTITGIRPGKPTADYLGKVSRRLTLFGAIFLMIIATIPSIIFGMVMPGETGLINAFSATGMLIVVSVALEIRTQLESQMMMKHYKGFLK